MRKILYTIIIIANYLYPTWANAINDRQSRPQAPVWHGVVTFVSNGDSLMVRPASGGAPVKIRLEGVDAPEICQAHGAASRQALQSRVMGRTVKVEGRRRDDYGRVLARISRSEGSGGASAGKAGNERYASDGGGNVGGDLGGDVGEWMVRRGHAWSYRFRRDAGPYALQESQAQAARRGLFADAQPVPPREFRKRHGPCDKAPEPLKR